jgi:hypothetical protein
MVVVRILAVVVFAQQSLYLSAVCTQRCGTRRG